MGSEDLLAGSLGDAVRKRELEVLGEELLDVWAADVLGLLDLDNLEDLWGGGGEYDGSHRPNENGNFCWEWVYVRGHS